MSALRIVGLILGTTIVVILINFLVVMTFVGGPIVWLLLGVAALAAIVWVAW